MTCLNRLTVRCFYPLGGVNRLTVEGTFQSKVPGVGVVDVFKSLKGTWTNPSPPGLKRRI